MAARNISQAGLDLITREEGVRKAAYLDQTQHWTIGIGHLLHPDELASGYIHIEGRICWWKGHGLWLSDCEGLLRQDVAWCVNTLNARVTVPLLQYQYDALCDFVFNVGATHFIESTLLKLLNDGKIDLIPAEFLRWTFSDGKQLPVLIARRQHEGQLWRGQA